MQEKEEALIIRADGNSYIIDFSNNLERILSRLMDDDVIGIIFLSQLSKCAQKDLDIEVIDWG